MTTGKIIHLVLVIAFWSLVIACFVSSSIRRRRDAKKDATERQAIIERLLHPDWEFYERHLQRPIPAALRELYADQELVTRCGLAYGKGNGLSTFNPLDEASLLDTRDQVGNDIVAFATSDCGDPIYLRPGPAESDTVYVTYHDENKTKVFAESVTVMLEKLRQANRPA
ncbi:MAG: SMI1/KNR4 family protein [Verrucomicrobiae bacterium]|nr:SMI1/KNR4 family protein [Verrucomicrobiae bacterium]